MINKHISVKDISQLLPGSSAIIGDEQASVSNVKPMDDCDQESLIWIGAKDVPINDLIAASQARIIITRKEYQPLILPVPSKTIILVDEPRLIFLRIVSRFFTERPIPGIHRSAIVDPGAVIGKDVYIGPHAVIGKVRIGDHTVIYGSCHIYDDVSIGADVIIHAGTVIGGDGFGYNRNAAGELEKFPHIGGVVIEDHVEICAGTHIAKGTLGNTLIGKGSKLDQLVHVAHNVKIGRHCCITAGVIFSGSVVVGDYSWIGPNTTIRDGLVLGEKVFIGIGAVVTKNIPDGETWLGNPAREIAQFQKIQKQLLGSL